MAVIPFPRNKSERIGLRRQESFDPIARDSEQFEAREQPHYSPFRWDTGCKGSDSILRSSVVGYTAARDTREKTRILDIHR